jgi:hypothetical protein
MPPVDEGMIHAWLDGALDAAEAERIAQLVATDPAWGAAAAEARGLIAASQRILGQLDAVPAQVVPAEIPTVSAAREQLRTQAAEPRAIARPAFRAQRWAWAAMLVMAVGAGTLWMRGRGSVDPAERAAESVQAQRAAVAPPVVAATPASAAPAAAVTATSDARREAAPPVNAPPQRAQPAPAPVAKTEARALARADADARVTPAAPTAAPTNQAADAAREAPAALKATAERVAATAGASASNAVNAVGAVATAPAAAPAAAPAPSLEGRGERLRANATSRLSEVVVTGAGASLPACWTVRLSEWTPEPSFGVPVGVLLDSARVARALVGSNLPAPPPGTWQLAGDSATATMPRAVLGYALTVRASLTTRTGTAVLGDASVPERTRARAVLTPSRCGAAPPQ